jgi:energy-coupling factor transporter transmembrane protein EcfT
LLLQPKEQWQENNKFCSNKKIKINRARRGFFVPNFSFSISLAIVCIVIGCVVVESKTFFMKTSTTQKAIWMGFSLMLFVNATGFAQRDWGWGNNHERNVEKGTIGMNEMKVEKEMNGANTMKDMKDSKTTNAEIVILAGQ